MRFVVSPGGVLSGTLVVPGDKSVSHRAVMLGAVAEGETRVSGCWRATTCWPRSPPFSAMGVASKGHGRVAVALQGVGLQRLRGRGTHLDLGNSGTAMRLLAGCWRVSASRRVDG